VPLGSLPHARVPTKARLEALVDGIFAVAMTLLVLDIRLPEGVRLGSNAQLLDHLGSIVQAFWVYVLSFAVWCNGSIARCCGRISRFCC
jgi:uncharacterized membrane protein